MVAKECRDEAEKTKARLKLGPVVNVKDKTKDFPKYISSREKLLMLVLSTLIPALAIFRWIW